MISKNSINRIILVGHTGKDPDLKYTPGGHPIATFSLATNESWVGPDKKKHDHTEWHSLVAWGRLAEFCKQYIIKGQMIYIEGKIHSQTWVDKNDIRQKKVEVVCDVITPLEWKKNKSVES